MSILLGIAIYLVIGSMFTGYILKETVDWREPEPLKNMGSEILVGILLWPLWLALWLAGKVAQWVN